MQQVALLYNPNAGRAHNRLATITRIVASLEKANLDVRAIPTEGPNTAGQQARALADDNDILFACGGDGTIHEVLQGIAHHPTCALGIIPLGSANALAHHLKLSLDPVRAALQQLSFQPQTIPVGKVTYTTNEGEQSRYFLVMAGAGPDGALVYHMLATSKHSLGRLSYYLQAAKLFSMMRFSSFTANTHNENHRAVSAMAIRVGDLGGLFSPLIRGAAVDDPQLTLNIVHTPGYLSLPAWFALSWARLHNLNRYAKTLSVDSFSCEAGHPAPVHIQADGESLGVTPMSVTLIPNALRLLMPAKDALSTSR